MEKYGDHINNNISFHDNATKKIKKMAKKRHSLAPIEFKNKKIGMKMKNQE